MTEKQKLTEELKAITIKFEAQHNTIEQAKITLKEYKDELTKKTVACSNLQETTNYLEQSLKSSNERALEAEYKYISTKKEVVTKFLKQNGKRLSMEIGKLRRLLPNATEDTSPDKLSLVTVIKEWGTNLESINATIVKFEEENNKLLNMVQSGRPLGALNDLVIPQLGDYSLIDLISIGQKLPSSRISTSNIVSPSNSLGLGSLSSIFSQLDSANSKTPSPSPSSFMLNGTTPQPGRLFADLTADLTSSHKTGMIF